MHDADLIERLDDLLPQTQCRQCGYAGCRPYAEALAAGRAAPNQCPPGGEDGAQALAAALSVAAQPLDPRRGEYKPPAVAVIDEPHCIGCTLCIQACPVDAIVGAAKVMHTVIAAACTGCALCLPPCPVDCIRMLETGADNDTAARRLRAQRAGARFRAREARLARAHDNQSETAAQRAAEERKQAAVARALARAQARLARR